MIALGMLMVGAGLVGNYIAGQGDRFGWSLVADVVGMAGGYVVAAGCMLASRA